MGAGTSSETFIIHSDGTVVYADELFRTLIGAEMGEKVIGTPVGELVSEQYREPLRDQIDRIESGQAPALGLSVTLQPFTGQSREVIAVSSLIDWEGAEQVQTSFLTFSEPGQSGYTMQDSALQEAPIGITISDPTRPDNPLIYVNDGFVEMTGYPHEEVLGRNCRFLQGPETRNEPVTQLREAVDSHQPVTVELRNYRKDGSMFWNRVSVVPITAETGELSHFVGFQEDITETKLYEQEKTLFKKQAEVAEQAMFITDRDGTIEYVNEAFERITGYSTQEAVGQTPRILKSESQDEPFYEDLWETITAGDVWEAELTNRTKGGQRYRTTQTIVPITDDRGEITHFAAIADDITDQRLRNQTLDVLNRVLRHNLRTAINVIDAHAELLEGDLRGSEHEAAITAIRRQTATMQKIDDRTTTIRNIWDRDEASHLWEIAAIRTFVDRYHDEYPHAEFSLQLNLDGSVSLPDADLFEVGFAEAVENAVIHNDQTTPRIEITVGYEGDQVAITVSDNGPGIPDTECQTIADGTETQLTHGTGIGLWIMEWVTTSLGGELDIAVSENGTEVTFLLPSIENGDSL